MHSALIHCSSPAIAFPKKAEDRAGASNKTSNILSGDPSMNCKAAAVVDRRMTAAEVEGRMTAAEE